MENSNIYTKTKENLIEKPMKWLITGVAGFIGSNLLETLLSLNQTVIGLDNFMTGHQHNLSAVKELVTDAQWAGFTFIEGDIREPATCKQCCENMDFVLHHAAIGSVPRSIEDPVMTNENNISGFLNIMIAARDAGVKRFVYAASSSTYGDHPGLPKVEETIGRPLSPYAVTKYVNELYGDVFARAYGFKTIGLRYFNIFGRRQDPNGAYAAVIPKWFAGLINNEPVYINGDGETSRDFCYIDNCVQANLLSAVATEEKALNQVYNVAYGERTTLNELFDLIRDRISKRYPEQKKVLPVYRDFQAGDVRHSLADIAKGKKLLGYAPEFSVKSGLDRAADWYMKNLG